MQLFFFNDTATTEISTLSLHDALPIYRFFFFGRRHSAVNDADTKRGKLADRKSTRLNSSHGYISYAVFCLKHTKYLRSAQFIPKSRNSYFPSFWTVRSA